VSALVSVRKLLRVLRRRLCRFLDGSSMVTNNANAIGKRSSPASNNHLHYRACFLEVMCSKISEKRFGIVREGILLTRTVASMG
jgi:hypothetical protein